MYGGARGGGHSGGRGPGLSRQPRGETGRQVSARARSVLRGREGGPASEGSRVYGEEPGRERSRLSTYLHVATHPTLSHERRHALRGTEHRGDWFVLQERAFVASMTQGQILAGLREGEV